MFYVARHKSITLQYFSERLHRTFQLSLSVDIFLVYLNIQTNKEITKQGFDRRHLREESKHHMATKV